MKLLYGILLWFISCSVVCADTPFRASLSYGITYDDNITRAELDQDIESAVIASFEAAIAKKLIVNDSSYLTLRTLIALNKYSDFSKFDNTRFGVGAGYQIKPTAGFTAPVYFLYGRYEVMSFDSDQRDGSVLHFTLGLRKRYSELLSLQFGYNNENADADHPVFDHNINKLYLDLEYLLTAENSMYITLSYYDGDVTATTRVTPKIKNSSTVNVRDDAFRELAPPRWAYKLDAETSAIKIGDIHVFNRYHGIDTSLFYYDVSAAGDNDYKGLIFSMYYSYQF